MWVVSFVVSVFSFKFGGCLWEMCCFEFGRSRVFVWVIRV